MASAPAARGLDASFIRRERRELTRMPVNDPRHPGLHAEKKAELSQYAREEMRLSGGVRVRDPEEERDFEPWQKRNRWRGIF